MERNPYYWKVDTAGNQLPYIDKMRFQMLADQEAAILKGIAGVVDLAERNFQVLENLPMLQASEGDGNYQVRVGIGDNFTTGNEIWLNYDLKDEAYGELRELLRTVKFRNALSVALNREAINDLLFLGLAKEANLGLSTASPYWDGEMATIAQINAEYDPDKARSMLAELGRARRDRAQPAAERADGGRDRNRQRRPHSADARPVVHPGIADRLSRV